MNIHEQIRELLARGQRVWSVAAGRVGEIKSVRGPAVCIETNDGFGAETSFLHGDRVELRYDWKDNCWTVRNVVPSAAVRER